VGNKYATIGSLPLLLLFGAALGGSLVFSALDGFHREAWVDLFNHPQVWAALHLSLLGGFIAALISLVTAIVIVMGLYQNKKLASLTGAMLAVPHVAVAIGVAFFIMPSGFLARVISATLTGWSEPPTWISNHDPYGISLIAVLVIKETPFLIWILASLLNREDVRRNFEGHRAAALSLGHGMTSIWLRVFLPQILPRMVWPLLVTFTYAATVVDVSLVIGPTQPPTLAALVWADINDANVATTARGAVGAWFMTGAVAIVAWLTWAIVKLLSKYRGWLTRGPTSRTLISKQISKLKFSGFGFIYFAIAVVLLLLSVAPHWPFPHLWPERLSIEAWLRIVQNPGAIVSSLLLALSTSLMGLALIIVWMESQAQARDPLILALSAAALGLPAILLGLGQYKLFLQFGLTGTALGLFLAHLVPVTAYMFIVLVGPYRSFDSRWRASAAGLLVGFPRFFTTIKLPLLKAPLLATVAIGFAVSFGQYVTAQLISAGRYSTLPMEAVTLTAGSNRSLTAAFAILLMLPPLVVFLLAGYFGKPRWSLA
jgi:putative thiamine transport system permease protein